MDDVTRNRIDAFDRCAQWFIDNAAGVNSNTKLKNLVVDFNADLATLHTEAGEQSGAVSESEEQTDVKGVSREDCVVIAQKVSRAAKAAEIEQPGIQARYPYPRNLNDEDLVNLLRGFAVGGNTDKQILEDYGAPVGWDAECTAKANAFEAASQAQAAAQGDKIGKRALVLSLTDGLMQMKRTATYIIENAFEDDVAALASWKSASHVEVPPKKKTPPPTP